METRNPKLAIAGRIVGFLLLLICIISWKLVDEDVLSIEKRNIIIYSMIGISLLSFILSYIASRERAIPELGSKLSVEEQFAALESTPTSFNSNFTKTDQFGFETVSSQTQNIIQSIVGTQVEPNQIEVQSAINSLSEGDIGVLSAAQASANPAPNRNATQILETVVLTDRNKETQKRTNVENIPLPNQQKISTPDLSWMEEDHQFITELSVKEVPLPQDSLEKSSDIQNNESINTPNLPNLDELLKQDSQKEIIDLESIKVPIMDTQTPDLPDIDSLF